MNVEISILCVTYNHEKYIRKVLDGFLNQKVNFRYEIIIHDDASTDDTQKIIKEYAEKCPEIIHAIYQKKNKYSQIGVKMFKHLYSLCKGKYIAICEGDDYWIYDQKLQKQFDWMERHPNTALCIHNAIRYDENAKEVIPQIMDMDSGYINDEELIFCNHGRIPSASFFCRAEYVKNLPKYYENCPVGDDPVRWWLAYNGDVYYMDKVWSVRNYMHEESWNHNMTTDIEFKQNHIRRYIQSLFEADKETNYRFHPYIEQYEYSQCSWDVFLKLSNEFKYTELKNQVEECKKNNCQEASLLYDKVYFLSVNRSRDYFDIVFKIAKSNSGKFFIYGAGIEAKKYAQVLSDNDIDFSGFVVSKKGELQTELMGHKIIEFNELEHKEEIYFWLCMNNLNRKEVIDMLLEEGISKII